MCNRLRVRWTIVATTPPQPWIACGRCGGLTAFQSSGKIRLNANGRKLDAWLIYKCVICEKTWNRPIFERQIIRDINPVLLEALQSNDRQLIRSEAFNLDALKRKAKRVEEFAEFCIEKESLYEPLNWRKLEIELIAPYPVSIRLDRLLASELGLSRARLKTLCDGGMVRTNPDRVDILRRRLKTGTLVTIDLSTEADCEQRWGPLATGRQQ